MVKSHEDLEIYKMALLIAKDIYLLTSAFPKTELFGMTDQIKRSVASVGANIAEGFGRFHFKDRLLFMYNARGSLYETRHFIALAKEVGYLTENDKLNMNKRIDILSIKLNNFIGSIKNQTTNNHE